MPHRNHKNNPSSNRTAHRTPPLARPHQESSTATGPPFSPLLSLCPTSSPFSARPFCFQFQGIVFNFSAALFYFEFYPAFYENYCRCHNSGMLKWVMNDGATNLIGE
ncbi:hypothetical protein QL285_056823 [Trifolium repens]|nr:hypothetical protein QL285_056823 [Trifolium repens]